MRFGGSNGAEKAENLQVSDDLYSLAGFLMALVAAIIIIVFVALETFTGLEIHIWACSSILPFQVC